MAIEDVLGNLGGFHSTVSADGASERIVLLMDDAVMGSHLISTNCSVVTLVAIERVKQMLFMDAPHMPIAGMLVIETKSTIRTFEDLIEMIFFSVPKEKSLLGKLLNRILPRTLLSGFWFS